MQLKRTDLKIDIGVLSPSLNLDYLKISIERIFRVVYQCNNTKEFEPLYRASHLLVRIHKCTIQNN